MNHPHDELPRDAALRVRAYADVGAGVEKPNVTIGVIPLTDCAPIVVAERLGLFRRHGLNVELTCEPSWSAVRDKVAYGVLDAAHMLAGVPLSSALGIGGVRVPMVTALSLDLNGNAITVSEALYQRMLEVAPMEMARRPLTAEALRRVIETDRAEGRSPLTLAVVFPTSSHHYLLRYWLAAAGIDPDCDVRIIIVPPPRMVECLHTGTIDGYCVGEPWNSLAVCLGLGRTVITGYEIWNNSPEKVLAVTEAWADRHPRTHRAMIRALLEASVWLDQPDNRVRAARVLAESGCLNVPEEVVSLSLTGRCWYGRDSEPEPLRDYHVFHRYAATFPWRSHAVWFLTQMMRWGQATRAITLADIAARVYRVDTYRQAARELSIPAPLVDDKCEGRHARSWTLSDATSPMEMGPDRFIDNGVFDPSRPIAYLERFSIRSVVADAEALAAANR